MKNNHSILWVLATALVSCQLTALGANGTWTNPSGGSWTNAANWNAGAIADSSGSTANFSTLNLSGDAIVTLHASRTIGNLSFDDLNTTKHNWSLIPGGANALTLASATPTVTVGSATTFLDAILTGTNGIAKAGTGKLALRGANTYTGTTAVNAGTLSFATFSGSATSPLNIALNTIAESAATLNLIVNASGTALAVNGSGTLRLASSTNNSISPDIYFGPNHSANSFWGARISSSLDLGNQQRFIFGKTGHNGIGQYGITNADCQFAGSISGSGGLIIIAQNNWTGTSPMEAGFALNAANTFTGPLEIQRGSVYLGAPNALVQGNMLTFNPALGNNARFFLYGRNALISDLSSLGTGASVIANGNLKTGASLTLGSVTLTISQTNTKAFGGTIADAFSEYDGSGSGTTGPLNLLKNGPATLVLTGICNHTGTTTVSGGTLQVDGTFGTSPITIQNGGQLAGAGVLGSPVTIQPGGTLAPGDAAIGIMTVNNSLSLAGKVVIEIAKNGSTLSSDRVTGLSSVSYGGTLIVTNIGAGTLSAGDSFNLFTATAYSGTITNITLPTLLGGLLWDTSSLGVNGSIAVVSTSGPPVITSQPTNLIIAAGSPAAFRIGAVGPGSLFYQWQKDSANISSATSSSFTIPSAQTNDSGAFRAIVTNSFGSTTSAVAILTVLQTGPTTITNGLVVYLSLDNNLNAQAGTTNNGTLYTGGATLGPRYTSGIIGAGARFANNATAGQPDDWAITLGSLEWVYANDFSVSFWERTANSGDGALMGNKDWTSGADVGWVISSLDSKNINWNAAGGTRRDVQLNPPFSDGNWHLVSVTFNRVTNQVTCYLDGEAMNTSDINPSGSASLNAGFPTLVGSSGNGTYAAQGDIDDLGIWNRVLTSDEVAAIYHTGLNNQPLTTASPGQFPVISTQPANMNLASGSTATFSVTATGPGPFTYQWLLNGTNIPGATNATLIISSLSTANQGIYTVLVRNASGASVSSGAVLTIYELAVTGQWDFSHGDLTATVGSDLEYLGDTSNRTAFTSLNLNGQTVSVMNFGSNTTTQGFYMRHGAKPNAGGHFVNQYTLVIDLLYPPSSNDQWRALFQTDPYNHAGNDADFYIGNGTSLPDANGVGAEGQFSGSLLPNTWYRVALVVDLAATSGQQLKKYVNGALVGSQSLSGGIDGRYALGPAALLFTSGLPGFTQPGFVSSIQFVNGPMSPTDIALLGSPAASKLPPGNAALQISGIARVGSTVTLNWNGPSGTFQVQGTSALNPPSWQPLGNPTTNRALSFSTSAPSGFYRTTEFLPDIHVGQLPGGEQSLPSRQILWAAGNEAQFAGRPVDLALSSDGKTVFIKNMNNLVAIDSATWTLKATLNYPGGGASMHGIAASPNGSHLYVTGCNNELYDYSVTAGGTLSFSRTINLPASSDPCGLAISSDGSKAYVCLSMLNQLAVVDLSSGTVSRQINVGIAPWDVAISPNGNTAYVSDWGGRFPIGGDLTAASAGTQVVVDSRGVAASGVLSIVNLVSGLETAQAPTGLHPSDVLLSPDGTTLYVANANSDTVTVLDTQSQTVKETILVRPDPAFPFGSEANGLALSKDGLTLFVASAGNNAIASVELPNAQHTNSVVQGFIPTDWYPGAVVADSNSLYVVNVKGLGSRNGQPANTSWQIFAFLGTANKFQIPSTESLSKYTVQVYEYGRSRQVKLAQQPPQSGKPAVPVPAHAGEPSVFQHVLYILKENKTYDQVFGDLTQANGNANLCIYPRFVSPNHHALAEQYVLLDNYYCNGVNSADGHSWATEANNSDHLEKSFGGFVRSYTFGDDALTYSSSGFIWNNVLEHGLSFRNYGEMDYASPSPSSATWMQIYQDFTNHTGAIHYTQNIGIASLRTYSSTNVPGWNLGIPDVVRADGFIKELRSAESNGVWASFHLLYLPNDHTGGPPTPQAQVADNDLALGQVVEAVTKSRFASNTVIFVNEDDPQSGYDHVDAHRSLCLVISPYTKRGHVVSTFFNQAGMLHTVERILGLPPMNQQDAMAPLMFDCFTNNPNFTPYTALANNLPLTDGVVASATPLNSKQRYWARKLQKMDFSKPDLIHDDTFNRYVWFTVKGNAHYPSEFVGGHGKGLKQLGLVRDKNAKEDDDD